MFLFKQLSHCFCQNLHVLSCIFLGGFNMSPFPSVPDLNRGAYDKRRACSTTAVDWTEYFRFSRQFRLLRARAHGTDVWRKQHHHVQAAVAPLGSPNSQSV